MNNTDTDDDFGGETPAWQARIYLDVDGVLSPLPPRDGSIWPPPTWPAWIDPQAFSSTPFPVPLLDELTVIAAEARVEIVWATTWPSEMIHAALTKAGYPHLRFRHLEPNGRIDKHTAIRDDSNLHPLPFVWIDDSRWPDDLAWKPAAPRLRITPKPHLGLTPALWTQARDWLGRHTGKTSR